VSTVTSQVPPLLRPAVIRIKAARATYAVRSEQPSSEAWWRVDDK
jgi:hypothetical protein